MLLRPCDNSKGKRKFVDSMSHHGDDSHAAARAHGAIRYRPGRGQRHCTLSSSVAAVALRGAAARPRSGQEAMWAEVLLLCLSEPERGVVE